MRMHVTKECVDPESSNTKASWLQIEIVPETTALAFRVSLRTSAKTLPCLTVSPVVEDLKVFPGFGIDAVELTASFPPF